MQVILTKTVQHLGTAGDLVKVKPGYARNYLLPRGFAVSATNRNVARIDHDRRIVAAQVAKAKAESGSIAERLGFMTLQFERLVGEDDKLFGSVTNRDIAEQLAVAGIELDHRWIALEAPVKALGKYEVQVKLPAEITATLKFWVVGKENA